MQVSFVRRLDELGRIVIPKEIRNNLNFNSGDLLDLNIGNNSLIIKKSKIFFNQKYIEEVINLIEYLSKSDIIVTDNEKVIAKSSEFDNLIEGTFISNDLKELFLERRSAKFLNGLKINNNLFLDGELFVKVLIKESNAMGLLIIKFNNEYKDINIFLELISRLLLQ